MTRPPAPEHPARTRVAVLFGGRSAEHAVSCVSAGSVLAAIDRSRYEVVPIGITPAGRWVLAADDPALLAIVDGTLPEVDAGGAAVVLAPDPTRADLVPLGPGPALGDVDVVFPLLHGPYGEDGTVQGLLELAGTPYVGSGVFASAAAMDKGHMKALFAAAGLPIGPYVVLAPRDRAAGRQAVADLVRDRLELPVFVKPCRAGSSFGITRVTRWEDLAAAVELACAHDPRVIVEAGIEGRELECGVLEDVAHGPVASVVAEVTVGEGHAFYDFQAKYLEEATRLDVPADLPGDVADDVRALAVRAFEVLGCEGLARADFFLDRDGRVLVNEVNTMPGFTPTSMFPRLWAASGVDYAALVDRLLQAALARPTGLR